MHQTQELPLGHDAQVQRPCTPQFASGTLAGDDHRGVTGDVARRTPAMTDDETFRLGSCHRGERASEDDHLLPQRTGALGRGWNHRDLPEQRRYHPTGRRSTEELDDVTGVQGADPLDSSDLLDRSAMHRPEGAKRPAQPSGRLASDARDAERGQEVIQRHIA
jgi:hypothetical protein